MSFYFFHVLFIFHDVFIFFGSHVGSYWGLRPSGFSLCLGFGWVVSLTGKHSVNTVRCYNNHIIIYNNQIFTYCKLSPKLLSTRRGPFTVRFQCISSGKNLNFHKMLHKMFEKTCNYFLYLMFMTNLICCFSIFIIHTHI